MKWIREYIRIALFNVFYSKLRSSLTILGIVVGVASVIVVLAVGNGVRADVLANESATTVSVGVDMNEVSDVHMITFDDLEAVRHQLGERITGIVTSHLRIGLTDVNQGLREVYTTFTLPDAKFDPEQRRILRGQFFDETHVQNSSLVGVINMHSALMLYGTTDVIGMELDITINQIVQTVRIIGVRYFDEAQIRGLEETVLLLNADTPVFIEIPYTAYSLWGGVGERFSSISAYLAEGEDDFEVAASMIRILSSRHPSSGESQFIREQLINWGVVESLLDLITTFVVIVAGISLIVGGIGVMNIMLVSVTERKREIGIRKALGAKTGSITIQFLFESTIISGCGGIIGILIGIGLSHLVSESELIEITTHISMNSIVLTTMFSCCVGILFGIYPARKAAKLNPIEALREL
jgi:putative ABC transport system permease protein